VNQCWDRGWCGFHTRSGRCSPAGHAVLYIEYNYLYREKGRIISGCKLSLKHHYLHEFIVFTIWFIFSTLQVGTKHILPLWALQFRHICHCSVCVLCVRCIWPVNVCWITIWVFGSCEEWSRDYAGKTGEIYSINLLWTVSAVVMLSFVSKKIREKKESALHAGLHAGTWIFRTVVGVWPGELGRRELEQILFSELVKMLDGGNSVATATVVWRWPTLVVIVVWCCIWDWLSYHLPLMLKYENLASGLRVLNCLCKAKLRRFLWHPEC
jgi:hypothetical protein